MRLLLKSLCKPYYADHTMLNPPQRAAHLVMFKISVGRDPKKNNYIFQWSKSSSHLNGPISTDVFCKIFKFLRPSLPSMTSSTSSPGRSSKLNSKSVQICFGKLLLVGQHWHDYVKGSIAERHIWVRPCFSSSFPHVLFVLLRRF